MKKIIITLSIIISIVTTTHSQTWIQRGLDIYGENAGDKSGSAVVLSANENTLIIGSPLNDDAGTDAGQVRVYEWNGSAWIQKGVDLNGLNAGDKFGQSVDINNSGDVIAIGAPYFNGTGNDIGMVRVFQWNGSAWVQMGTDLIGGTAGLQDYFGSSIDLTDNLKLAVGAPGGGPFQRGEVKVFEWTGTSWSQMGSALGGDATYDLFGQSLSFNSLSDRLVIGSPQNDGGGANAGAVKVYIWNGTNWTQEGSTVFGTSPLDFFGRNVAVSGYNPIFMVNAPYGSSGSYIRVFEWNAGISDWDQRGNDLPGFGYIDFGTPMSLGGPFDYRITVGYPTSGSSGVCKFYYYNSTTDVYEPDYAFTDILGSNSGDNSGYATSALNAGNSGFAVGAPENDGNGSNSGQVRVFDFCYAQYANITPTVHACSYASPSGNYTYTSSGFYLDTLMNAGGCDSIISIDLTLFPPSDTITADACISYTVPSGNQTYYSSSIYTDTLTSIGGCDSIITIDLNVQQIDVSITNTGNLLVVNTLSSMYQWVECPSYTPIVGANMFSYTPSVVGSYAVIITNSSLCSDTSVCSFVNVGIESYSNQNIILYPNPSENFVTISGLNSQASIQLLDAVGKTILMVPVYNNMELLNIENLVSGIYFIQIREEDHFTIKTLIKK